MPCDGVQFGCIHLQRDSSLATPQYVNSVSKIDPGANVALAMDDLSWCSGV
jgi:hypothetical protein